ncbi:MAG: hypothetical protein QHH13_06315 [Melioribacter sp.]|uniref:hypothetical protein n=1 Tax=Rosettibacter primus TaxID=3111523 RepID=UPI00247EB12B|nr:hypothetical protein [Melioribacter sp.]
MKKNEDLILKYLSDMMDEKEKANFEDKLKSSDELNKEYERTLSLLNQFKEFEKLQLDERYFASLLPRVNEKIYAKKKISFNRKLSYVLPAIIILILIYIMYPASSPTFDENLQSITKEMVNYYSNNLDEFTTEQIVPVQYEENYDATFLEDFELPKEYINKYVPAIFEESQVIDKLPDEDLSAVYVKLSKFNIQ